MSGNKPTDAKATHPMIALLTNLIHKVNDYLSQREIVLAANGLLSIMDEINPAHQDDDLRKKIEYIGHEKGKTQGRYLAAAETECTNYRRQIMTILWKYGYFTDEAYRSADFGAFKDDNEFTDA